MTFEEIKTKIEKVMEDDEDISIGEIAELEFEFEKYGFPAGTKLVVEDGGGEGGGEDVERVIFFPDELGLGGGTYIRFTGYYSSYNGTDWDEEFEEVFPRPTMVTLYKSSEEIKEEDAKGKTV